jgi:uncharacterized Zn ribbon protein
MAPQMVALRSTVAKGVSVAHADLVTVNTHLIKSGHSIKIGHAVKGILLMDQERVAVIRLQS